MPDNINDLAADINGDVTYTDLLDRYGTTPPILLNRLCIAASRDLLTVDSFAKFRELQEHILMDSEEARLETILYSVNDELKQLALVNLLSGAKTAGKIMRSIAQNAGVQTKDLGKTIDLERKLETMFIRNIVRSWISDTHRVFEASQFGAVQVIPAASYLLSLGNETEWGWKNIFGNAQLTKASTGPYNRFRILEELVSLNGETTTIKGLTEKIPLSDNAMGTHLLSLKEVGILTFHSGSENPYKWNENYQGEIPVIKDYTKLTPRVSDALKQKSTASAVEIAGELGVSLNATQIILSGLREIGATTSLYVHKKGSYVALGQGGKKDVAETTGYVSDLVREIRKIARGSFSEEVSPAVKPFDTGTAVKAYIVGKGTQMSFGERAGAVTKYLTDHGGERGLQPSEIAKGLGWREDRVRRTVEKLYAREALGRNEISSRVIRYFVL